MCVKCVCFVFAVACKLTLDPNTANKRLLLSEGNRKVTVGKKQPYPDHPDRFESEVQVLCEQGFCGRFYWEVEMSLENDTAVEIAVAYKGITGENESEFGMGNDESWCLGCNTVGKGETVKQELGEPLLLVYTYWGGKCSLNATSACLVWRGNKRANFNGGEVCCGCV